VTRTGVLSAVAEFDHLGREAFLKKTGFDPAREYFLEHDGTLHDSKPIIGYAHGMSTSASCAREVTVALSGGLMRPADDDRKGLQVVRPGTRAAGSADGGDVHTHRYRIVIAGGLGRVGCQAFEEFKIVSNDGHTSLIADLDQAALYGALIRVQSLGLELVELARIPSEAG
jgi:hypothetical protein